MNAAARTVAGRTVALAAGALLAAAACSGGGGGGGATGTSGNTAERPGRAGTTVAVSETEFALKLSHGTFSPGRYTFVADDHGAVTHALAITGPGLATRQTGTIAPGGQARLTVTLKSGEYELWCPVDGHKALGMDTHIRVTGSGSPAPSGTATPAGGGGGGGY